VIQLCCGLLVIAGTFLAARVFEVVDLFRFPLCWAGLLLALDGAARLRRGSSPLRTPADWLFCAGASVLFWDVFELVDLRLKNWWYTGVSEEAWTGAAFGALSFATVLPAVRLGLASLTPVQEPEITEDHGGWRAPLAAGVALLALALAFPRQAFPLAWLFLWPLCEAANAALPRGAGLPSPLRTRSDPRLIRRLLLLALPLGLAWEVFNWRCPRGWVYTVPHFEHPKLFEMPLPGYLGYLPFLLEAGAALALLDRLRPHLRGARGAAAFAAVLALHAGADRLARGQTVISVTPRLAQLRRVPPELLALLAAEGVRTPRDVLEKGTAGLGPRAAEHVTRISQLAVSTRMGVPRAERWVELGIDPSARWQAVAASTGDDPALVRLWLDAAKSGVSR
jgi:hypothetical protein